MEQEQQWTYRDITLVLTIEQQSATERDDGASLLPYHSIPDEFEQTETRA